MNKTFNKIEIKESFLVEERKKQERLSNLFLVGVIVISSLIVVAILI